ncbi:MAG: Phosphoglycolate phosphatase [Burkholderiaceae bacterium]|jgi:phosphoglycolate phosphatase|nr:MAG: Phosphoglycolate phosphatase [Burkholderiaceae bacterium]
MLSDHRAAHASLVPVRSPIEAAILDLDGTLVDTLDDFVAALNLTLGEFAQGRDAPRVDRAAVARLVGKGSEHLLRSVLNMPQAKVPLARFAINPEALAELMASYQRHYRAVNGRHARVYPGVAEGLALLERRGLPLACATNKPTEFARALLGTKGLARHFRFVFGGDAFARGKPDPLPLLQACAALGTTPARTLMIGDSRNDAQAARGAGCPVLLLSYGYNHGEPVHGVGADGVIDSLAEVDAWLDRRVRAGPPASG